MSQNAKSTSDDGAISQLKQSYDNGFAFHISKFLTFTREILRSALTVFFLYCINPTISIDILIILGLCRCLNSFMKACYAYGDASKRPTTQKDSNSYLQPSYIGAGVGLLSFLAFIASNVFLVTTTINQIAISQQTGNIIGHSPELTIALSILVIITVITGCIKDYKQISRTIGKLFNNKAMSASASKVFSYIPNSISRLFTWIATFWTTSSSTLPNTILLHHAIIKKPKELPEDNRLRICEGLIDGQSYIFLAILGKNGDTSANQSDKTYTITQEGNQIHCNLYQGNQKKSRIPYAATVSKYLLITTHIISRLCKQAVDWILLITFTTLSIGVNSTLSIFTMIFGFLIAGLILVENRKKLHAPSIEKLPEAGRKKLHIKQTEKKNEKWVCVLSLVALACLLIINEISNGLGVLSTITAMITGNSTGLQIEWLNSLTYPFIVITGTISLITCTGFAIRVYVNYVDDLGDAKKRNAKVQGDIDNKIKGIVDDLDDAKARNAKIQDDIDNKIKEIVELLKNSVVDATTIPAPPQIPADNSGCGDNPQSEQPQGEARPEPVETQTATPRRPGKANPASGSPAAGSPDESPRTPEPGVSEKLEKFRIGEGHPTLRRTQSLPTPSALNNVDVIFLGETTWKELVEERRAKKEEEEMNAGKSQGPKSNDWEPTSERSQSPRMMGRHKKLQSAKFK